MVLLNAKTRKSMTEILSLFGYFQQF